MAGLKCEHCGQSIRPDDEFCINCGRMIPKRESVPDRQEPNNVTPTGFRVSATPGMSTPAPQEEAAGVPVDGGFPADGGVPVDGGAPAEGIPVDGFCPACGSKTRAGWSFCMQCGTRLPLARAAAPAFSATPMSVTDSAPMTEPAGATSFVGADPASSFIPGEPATTEPAPSFIPERPTSAEPVKTVRISTIDDFMPAPELDTGTEWDKTDAGVPEDDFPTSVYEEDDDDAPTMIYGDEPTPLTCTITRMSDGESFTIPYPATLGRGSMASVRIPGNRFIGRVHASVKERDGQLYVTDEGSANHTYLNGEMIPAHEERPLSDGDVLSLAKEEFAVSIS